jgi:hypothetical protein
MNQIDVSRLLRKARRTYAAMRLRNPGLPPLTRYRGDFMPGNDGPMCVALWTIFEQPAVFVFSPTLAWRCRYIKEPPAVLRDFVAPAAAAPLAKIKAAADAMLDTLAELDERLAMLTAYKAEFAALEARLASAGPADGAPPAAKRGNGARPASNITFLGA